MNIFGKKKAKKVEVKSETPNEVEIKVRVRPLVKIEEVETAINGEKVERVFRLHVGDRDVITVSPREYDEIFMEMLRHKDAGELIHDISAVHAEKHLHAEKVMRAAASGIAEIFKKMEEAAEKTINS